MRLLFVRGSVFRRISERDHKTSNPLFANARVLVLVAVLGLLLHGFQAGRLGIYWDDSTAFLRTMQNVNGDTMKFVRGGQLPSYRETLSGFAVYGISHGF